MDQEEIAIIEFCEPQTIFGALYRYRVVDQVFSYGFKCVYFVVFDNNTQRIDSNLQAQVFPRKIINNSEDFTNRLLRHIWQVTMYNSSNGITPLILESCYNENGLTFITEKPDNTLSNLLFLFNRGKLTTEEVYSLDRIFDILLNKVTLLRTSNIVYRDMSAIAVDIYKGVPYLQPSILSVFSTNYRLHKHEVDCYNGMLKFKNERVTPCHFLKNEDISPYCLPQMPCTKLVLDSKGISDWS